MRWLYRLQTRFGLTGPEGAAALVLLAAAAGGGVARHFQATSSPLPPDFYAAADAAFAVASSPPDSTDAAAPLTLVAPPADSTAEPSAATVAADEVEAAAAPRRTGKAPPVRTNLNTASEQDLQQLPRIGPALARRIVEHRRTHGPFRHPDRITDVRGIGDKTLEKLRPWIHV